MKRLLFLLIFFLGCKELKPVSQHQEPFLSQLFSLKEVKEEITRFYGKDSCYNLVSHDSTLIMPFYDEVKVDGKVNVDYISSGCQTPDMVIFIHKEKNTVYLQLFESDGKIHRYDDYPLLNHGASTYFKIELDGMGAITRVGKHGYVAN